MASVALYKYAKTSQDELVEISQAKERREEKFLCLNCGDEMIARCGTKRVWHFAHKRKECDFNKYLHTLAERRICDWFNRSEHIWIKLPQKVFCPKRETCELFKENEGCVKVDEVTFDLKEYYGKAELEKEYEVNGQRFVADILCSIKKENTEPLFIEIDVTHPCTEEKKKSKLKIIEFHIEETIDIDDIIGKTICASDKISLYNFKTKEKEERKNGIYRLLQRAGLTYSMKVYIERISCHEIEFKEGRACIDIGYIEDIPYFSEHGGFYNVATAMFYRDYPQLRLCVLCKHHIYNNYLDKNICRAYKRAKLEMLCSDNDPKKCCEFVPDRKIIEERCRAFDEERQNMFVRILRNT